MPPAVGGMSFASQQRATVAPLGSKLLVNGVGGVGSVMGGGFFDGVGGVGGVAEVNPLTQPLLADEGDDAEAFEVGYLFLHDGQRGVV